MGSAAARELARSGHEVTLYEQFRLGHSRGSSHGRSRIVRLAYPELEFVELARVVPGLTVRTPGEPVAYFRRSGDPLPSVVQLDPETRGHALYSLYDPLHGLKAGVHHAGPESDPDDPGEPDRAIVERVAEWVAGTYPDADGEPVAAETCMYTTTPDEHFILERRGRVVIGSACSCNGL